MPAVIDTKPTKNRYHVEDFYYWKLLDGSLVKVLDEKAVWDCDVDMGRYSDRWTCVHKVTGETKSWAENHEDDDWSYTPTSEIY